MLLALLLAMLALPAVAGAHSELVSSDPAANASLASAPKRLSLTFSEAIDPSWTTAAVQRPMAPCVR